MKSLLFFLTLFIALQSFSQVANVAWKKAYGGSSTEVNGNTLLNSIGYGMVGMDVSTDGKIYMATNSSSSDGMLHGNSGLEDIWVLKLDSNGDTLWTRRFGGTDYERAFGVIATGDSGCVVVGYSASTDGPFTANHAATYADGVVIRLDANGNTKWLKMFGGENLDYLYDIILTSDGALMACGETGSNTGDLAGTGTGLNWVIKMNLSNGDKIWSKTYAGPDNSLADMLENFNVIKELSGSNGIIITGSTAEAGLDPNAYNILYAKIDLNGNLSWIKKVGSATGEDGSAAIIDNGSGTFSIAGRLTGSGDDAPATYYGGNGDVWLLRFDAAGNLVWNKNYGGTGWDFAFDALGDAYGNTYLCGFTRSTNNDAAAFPSKGLSDFWFLKVNSAGDTLYTRRFGGSGNDYATTLSFIGSNSIIIAGRTESSNGDVTDNHGGRDLWVIRIDSITPAAPAVSIGGNVSADPNACVGDNISVTLSNYNGDIQWQSSTDGIAFSDLSGETSATLNVSSIAVDTWFRAVLTYLANPSDTSDTAFVSVNPIPDTPVISFDSTGGVIVITSDAAAGNQWYNLSGIIADSTASSLVVNADNSYYTIVSLLGCASLPSNTIVIDWLTSINDVSVQWSIFPNPSQDYIVVNSLEPMSAIRVFDSAGKGIFEQIDILSKSTTIDIRMLPAGTYVLEVESSKYKTSKIFVVQ